MSVHINKLRDKIKEIIEGENDKNVVVEDDSILFMDDCTMCEVMDVCTR